MARLIKPKWSQPMTATWMPQQFENPANIDARMKHTAQEILTAFPERSGCFSLEWNGRTHRGCASVLKKKRPNLKSIAVEPKDSQLFRAANQVLTRFKVLAQGYTN
jgi:cysteine synthase A